MRFSMISAALVAAFVGFGSSIPLVLAAAVAVGADAAQTASWLLAVCLAKAAGSAALSLWTRMPLVLAWSTPGAALVAATEGISLAEAVGAFVVTGLLMAATGVLRPLERLIARIPDGVAAGMLAGVILPFCLRLAGAAADLPALVLPMVAVYAVVRFFGPGFAVLAALAAGLALAFAGGQAVVPAPLPGLPALVFIPPAFDPGAVLGLAVPLYLVTMASQNLPGFATMRAAGFEPPVRLAQLATGGLSALAGLFGGHTISMAAMTAAICLDPEVEPDRSRRWRIGLAYAAVWVGLGLAGPVLIALILALPPALLAAMVALAMLAPLSGALTGAFAAGDQRFAATVTLIVTASGTAVFGIGAAFWGLAAGLAALALDRMAAARARR
ncbi:benzoate/H(+) symporter BenE family transporter [Ruixingdingia sedimenti]|uniref:Benzoate/H(+) symporter BenE family transporter n=1 Tax=Ruixingdingia sedimenti TaxID=3073604 RepID=A0ABU1FCI9_9RHOB|nr:benzoate/H(+) symporter BenE family transporter [Xinfangfangia sp. LG-4]MDR5654107.1 benzoate/H(+) symporter BenE family transporter [Xinfangfangia sp. LG-4]